VRLKVVKGRQWGDRSEQQPYFYGWQGQLSLSAPKEILDSIVLPIVKFAASVGGVGRGWRRPLHIFHMNNGNAAARGTLLKMTHRVTPQGGESRTVAYELAAKPEKWGELYDNWRSAAKKQWGERVTVDYKNPQAEVFSPKTCAIYAVPGPVEEPIDGQDLEWLENNGLDTRGEGMDLVYEENPPQRYKRNPDLGGNAANGNPHCSWVSIKRIGLRNQQEGTNCQEVVCLFMGGQTPTANHVRSRFLKDLSQISGGTHLFGVKPS
jgi:CRISPR-associated protein Cmr6